jgi:putative two-component system response regulator
MASRCFPHVPEIVASSTENTDALLSTFVTMSASDTPRAAASAVSNGHAAWLLTAYPQGLKGEQIPLSARVMAVADVYDALITKRVYKPAMPHETAAQIIMNGAGAHFDPEVVDAFVHVVEEFKAVAQRYADH